MPKIVGVKFKKSAKVYYFEAGNHEYTLGCGVIAETSRGNEYGTVALLPTDLDDSQITSPLKPIVRLTSRKDEEKMRELEAKHDETMQTATKKIAESGLDMKLVDVEYSFDGSKLVVYFTADGRVDFRDLVKELASTFKTRIELRQIGPRDECKMLGGIGPCGRPCCCSVYMSEYSHVSIKMAKNQNLSLNPTKINGLCDRLMCCLSYENEHYAETNKKMPKIGATVTTTDGRSGSVVAINQLYETVRIRFEVGDKSETLDMPLAEVIVKGKGEVKSEKPDENPAE
ncbi:MAG: stage 0 sporulation family protein [Clostridia bacterium]|nr:stage 0 sporulation family protein [Clostridia bacterium]